MVLASLVPHDECGETLRKLMDMHPQTLQGFCSDEWGQDLIEYALIAAIVGLAAIAAISTMASNINSAFSAVGNRLSSALGS